MFDILKELIQYLIKNKKWWLVPIILFLVLFGGLIIYSQGAAVSPFIYTFF